MKLLLLNKFFKYYKHIFFIYIIIISFLAFMPNNAGVDTGSDKTNHILAFVFFAVLHFLAFRKSFIFIFLSGIVFGVYIEVVQYFLPYRSCDFLDIIADAIGISLGVILILIGARIGKGYDIKLSG